MRDKIAEILYTGRFYKPTKKVLGILTDKILSLFDISKIEVEIRHSGNSIVGRDCNCNGKSYRPATWDDIKKGGVLRIKE